MRSMTSRPRAPSRRSPEAVIEPSGNAKAAATLSRTGLLGPSWAGRAISVCCFPTRVDRRQLVSNLLITLTPSMTQCELEIIAGSVMVPYGIGFRSGTQTHSQPVIPSHLAQGGCGSGAPPHGSRGGHCHEPRPSPEGTWFHRSAWTVASGVGRGETVRPGHGQRLEYLFCYPTGNDRGRTNTLGRPLESATLGTLPAPPL